jgi:hypothetical protein
LLLFTVVLTLGCTTLKSGDDRAEAGPPGRDAGDSGTTRDAGDGGTMRRDAGPDGGRMGCVPELVAPENGNVDRTMGVEGDVATYSCDDGFVLTGNGGSSTRICQASGAWTGSPPTCEPVVAPCTPNPCLNGGTCTEMGDSFTCDCEGTGYSGSTCTTPIVCTGAMAPMNGMVSATSAPYPTSVTYSCNTGYTLEGATLAQCRADGSFSAGPPTCRPNACFETLTNPANGMVNRTMGATGDVATYSCASGYTLSGTAMRTCLPSGTWSGSAPTCERIITPCMPNPCLNGGTCTPMGESFTCNCGGTGYMGPTCMTPVTCTGAVAPTNGTVSSASATFPNTITYGCNTGYTLEGSSSAMCRADGTFSSPAPTCRPNPCEPLTDPTNGTVSPRTGTTGSSVTYSCNAGYTLSGAATRTCQATGTWSGSAPTCTPNPCSETLSAPLYGSVSRTTGATGDVATYTCQGSLRLIGSATRTCQASGTWSGTAPVCRICSGGSWCWENPLPQGNGLNAVWSTSPSDAWAVGNAGTILRWNGSAWSSVASGTTSDLLAVWGSSSTDVWAVGRSGTIRRWNGTAWTSVPSGTSTDLRAVWGTSSTNVWAAGIQSGFIGSSGVILRWNGTAWSLSNEPSSGMASVWGSSATSVWASGGGGTTLRWNGSTWNSVSSGTTRDLLSLWGTSSTNVWAVGWNGTIIRWDGTTWSSVSSGTTNTLRALWGSSSSDLWAVGDGGITLRWNGSAWSNVPSGTTTTLRGVWGSSSSDVWAVGDGGAILRWNGSAWNSVSSGPTTDLSGAWGSSSADVWAVGDVGTILHWNGSTWGSVSSGTASPLRGVWGSSSSDVWAVGDGGTILRWNGTAWSSVSSGTTTILRGVWGSSSTNVWAVGDGGTILRWNGSTWASVPSGATSSLFGVWGSSSTDVWAVGNGGTILRWNGSTWGSVSSGSTSLLTSVWGSASNDVWVSSFGNLLRWNGSAWNNVPSGTANELLSIWGSSSTDVWVVGFSGFLAEPAGAIMRWNGSAWNSVPSGTTFSLRGVWGSSSSDIWAVGTGGTILRHRP